MTARNDPYRAIQNGEPGTIGWRIRYFRRLDSTQKRAAQLANDGEPHGSVVIAERQTAGRGRMGRQWFSPSGVNLYLTIILRPVMPADLLPQLNLAAGLAVAEAMESVAHGLIALKWPNDLWLSGRKSGGIIAEALPGASNQQVACVLLGIGLNVNLAAEDIPAELRGRTTSIRIATGRSCDRIALAAAIFSRLNSRYKETEREGFASIRGAWEHYSALTGKYVTVINGDERQSGTVKGVDIDGALLLESSGRLDRILAGDVTIEGAYD